MHRANRYKEIDKEYSYSGELGVNYSKVKSEFKLWAPLATEVLLKIYKDDNIVYAEFDLVKESNGVWNITLEGDFRGFFYTYYVTNSGETKQILDPYAKSMSSFDCNTQYCALGAIIDIDSLGPKLQFANIPGYKTREDAIIWEIHIRDFTSDPGLNTKARFGTYRSFIEKLDYIKSLGITHIQLLPVMAHFIKNDRDRITHSLGYKANGTNYNWGYDPYSYFSPEGVYSEDPYNPELRIIELKELINEIHKAGLGVILDVVYNHTAKVSILNDIVPGYYYFNDSKGKPKESYGGGSVGSTHFMSRKLIIDSILYWIEKYKIDGFRFDLMGELDADTVQKAYDLAIKINPDILMIGEGWRTYLGDDGESVKAADQDWISLSKCVAVFSDDIRNELKSGYGCEGVPMFVTGGMRNIKHLYKNIMGHPGNMKPLEPGSVVQYVAAHDNLPLHDVIAQSIKKDPDKDADEIHRRIRLANSIILTSQGIVFLHAGQEYGRTKQWRDTGQPEDKGTYVDGFKYPWFVHDSVYSSDIINMIDWGKIENDPVARESIEYTKGLLALRKSTDAFKQKSYKNIRHNCEMLHFKGMKTKDSAIAYSLKETEGAVFYIFINAGSTERIFITDINLKEGEILVDNVKSGTEKLTNPSGVEIIEEGVKLSALTATVIKVV